MDTERKGPHCSYFRLFVSSKETIIVEKLEHTVIRNKCFSFIETPFEKYLKNLHWFSYTHFYSLFFFHVCVCPFMCEWIGKTARNLKLFELLISDGCSFAIKWRCCFCSRCKQLHSLSCNVVIICFSFHHSFNYSYARLLLVYSNSN